MFMIPDDSGEHPGGGGNHILRQMDMCRSNGRILKYGSRFLDFFYKKNP